MLVVCCVTIVFMFALLMVKVHSKDRPLSSQQIHVEYDQAIRNNKIVDCLTQDSAAALCESHDTALEGVNPLSDVVLVFEQAVNY